MFFFEKKNQKAFASRAASTHVAISTKRVIRAGTKVFLLLFLQKKKTLP